MQDVSAGAYQSPFSIVEVVFFSTAGAEYAHRYVHRILSDDRCGDQIDQKISETACAIRPVLAGEWIFRSKEVAPRQSSRIDTRLNQ